LPIRQFVRKSDGWHERQVGLADGRRAFGLSPTPIPATAMPEAVANAEMDTMLEVCFAGGEVLTRLAKVIAGQGGGLLAVDYGYGTTQTGDTLQGVRRHAYADVLDAPGETDISAHVDFGALANVARAAGLATQPPATQGQFLTRLGIGERAAALSRANPTSAADIKAAHDRLVAEGQMGALFKVFCAHSPDLAPPGFTA